MSRSATPAALIWAMTLSICAALARIAPLASADCVTTPAEIVATSGTRFASAWADTDNRVPLLDAIVATWALLAFCAEAFMARALRESAAASNRGRTTFLLGRGWKERGMGFSVEVEEGRCAPVNEP